MDPLIEKRLIINRRHFFGLTSAGIGAGALASLLNTEQLVAGAETYGGLADLPHFAPKAKRVIYLFQSGGPSQMDLFDYKPNLQEFFGSDLPDSVRNGPAAYGDDFHAGEISCCSL